MDKNLLGILLQEIVPLVATAIRAHRNATGHDPTDAEVMAALSIDAESAISRGLAFLASKGVTG